MTGALEASPPNVAADSAPGQARAPAAGHGDRSPLAAIRRDAVLLGVGNAGVVVAQLAFRSILIILLLPADYGRLSLILAVYNTVWILGASGLPSVVSRHIALVAPADDTAIIRAALRAGVVPTAVAGAVIALTAGVLLHSVPAGAMAAAGLSALVYSLLAMGILRGRGHVGAAAAVMPLAALFEVLPLVLLVVFAAQVTLLSAFAAFCAGNIAGALAGAALVARTAPPAHENDPAGELSVRSMLGTSAWLALATAGVALLPLVLRAAASFDSFTTVALVDVALVLLSLPQRLGTVILLAVVPRATREIARGRPGISLTPRQAAAVTGPFLIAATLIWVTPASAWVFALLGRPAYADGRAYLAIALLAGPARILYGLSEGLLIAFQDGRALARMVLAISLVAAVAILGACALGSTVTAFTVFAAAFWLMFARAHMRVGRLAARLAMSDQ